MHNYRLLATALLFLNFLIIEAQTCHYPTKQNNLVVDKLATSWDEAIPLGNALLGALIWENEGKLRFSLDRADLWDLRPVENLSLPEYSFKWVQEQVKNNTYQHVQELFDVPYDHMPAPSKIPGAALEIETSDWGAVKRVELDIATALCIVEWENGIRLETFVHATNRAGWFRFYNVPAGFQPRIIAPAYKKTNISGVDSPVTGQDLQRLGYEQGKIAFSDCKQVYRQQGYKDFEYEVAVSWKKKGEMVTGIWSISSSFSEKEGENPAGKQVDELLKKVGYDKSFKSHCIWWKSFWSKSAVSIPDPLLEKQYYLEMYKFGSVARADAPPISLQAIWTADNGKLPPWKGDYHHDLNTQLSYWPAYTGNHLELEAGFTNWLWKYKDNFKDYTRQYFGTSGLNVPGVTTLTGQPMGGWIQYAFGPTVSAWLAHHFYLHWTYSQDRKFLKEKAYPWIREVAVYLDEIAVKDVNGLRKLPISSSPEVNDNSRNAWFTKTTNFDLAFIRWTFEKAAELARELNQEDEARQWTTILSEWPDFSLDTKNGLAFAPDYPYEHSHRHFSHLVGWHPLGLIDWSKGEAQRNIIRSTLATLKEKGSDWWTGYSFSWLGNLYARAGMGQEASDVLHTFAECFCLKNSFHVNGDQCKAGHSRFTYRPFTLEGNFAFASAIQEMLIQSHTGIVSLFPAIPDSWTTISFNQLRTTGAFLISAQLVKSVVSTVQIQSEKGGILRLANPFGDRKFRVIPASTRVVLNNGILEITTKAGERYRLETLVSL